MRISPASYERFEPPLLVQPSSEVYRSNADCLRRGGFTSGLHYVRRAMMMLWIDYHRSNSATQAIAQLQSRVALLKDIYALSKRNVSRDNFDMEYGLAAVLTGDAITIETFLANAEIYDPASSGYGFYKSFVGVLKGLLTNNTEMIQQQRQGIERFNATKYFYWPSKAVMFACVDGDCAKLASQVSAIEKKFTDYARKMNAFDGNGDIKLEELDLHFFCPYSDLAFYALAYRHCGDVMNTDSFWLPKALVGSCGKRIVEVQAK